MRKKILDTDPISLDMLRLKSLVDKAHFESFTSVWLSAFDGSKTKNYSEWEKQNPKWATNTLLTTGTLKMYENFKFNGYRYNFTWCDEFGRSFYFGYLHNSAKPSDGFNTFTIEYNPNKLDGSDFLQLVLNAFILHKGFKTSAMSYTTHNDLTDTSKEVFFTKEVVKQVELVSVDICRDFEINILDFVINQRLKRELKIFSYGGDDITYMIGKAHGRVKLYNKKREMLANTGTYIPQLNLTRFEISLNFKCPLSATNSVNLQLNLTPSITHTPVDLLTDPLDKLVLLGLQQSPETFKLLSRRKKEKYSKLMSCIDGSEKTLTVYQFEETRVKRCVYDYIQAHFM